jgi:hypothetical protein
MRWQSSSRRLGHAIAVWKTGCFRLQLRWGNKAWQAADLIRVGGPLTDLVAGICPGYRVARRAEVAEYSARVCVVRPLSKCRAPRGQRGSHQHSHDPSQHWALSSRLHHPQGYQEFQGYRDPKTHFT